jgi:hypothetical protein
MTLHVIDAKTLGSTILGSLEIESIAVNSTASWVYLGRGFSIDPTTQNLIACQIDPTTGKVIGAPIFLDDHQIQSNKKVLIRISDILVDESKKLLYISRVLQSIDGTPITPEESAQFEAIVVYELDANGRPIQIVRTCNMQVANPQPGPNDDGIYSFTIHQNHLYAVGQRTNGILIYKLENGLPTENQPFTYFPTTACQQVKAINNKLYFGTYEYANGVPPAIPTLQIGILSPNGDGIPTNIQSFQLPTIEAGYLDFLITERGIFPQKTRYLANINRPVKRSLNFLPFNLDGFPDRLPDLSVQLQPLAQEIRALGVNSRNELWFAADDKYQDALDGSEDSRGIKIQKHDSNESFVEKLKFARLVAVAENGTPVLLCDDVRAGELLTQVASYPIEE